MLLLWWPTMATSKRAASGSKKATAKRRGPAELSADHKEAMAVGRRESAAVSRYLDALDAHAPKRGRKRTEESVRRRLEQVETELASASAIKRLNLLQERTDLMSELTTMSSTVDLSGVEADFVAHAANYGRRHGISYATWREAGVSPATLRAAGIGR